MIDALLGQVRNTALIVGVVALVGLILQKKSLSEIISEGLPRRQAEPRRRKAPPDRRTCLRHCLAL